MPRRSTGIAFLILAYLNANDGVLAQAPTHVGTEFQVNTVTFDSQSTAINRSIDFESNGDFVVVWEDAFQDGSSSGTFGQRFASSGTKLGTSFQVSTYTIGAQQDPAVALDANGDFVVAWRSYHQDGNLGGVFGRRFDSSGAALGNEFLVNTFTLSMQTEAVVARDSDGDFIVAWTSFDQDGASGGVFARRFNSSGVAQGSEIQVNFYTAGSQRFPAVDMHSDGGFVVTWKSSGQDGDGYGVFGQRFSSLGARQGTELQINNYVTGDQSKPAVGLDASGDFVVAWESAGQDGDSSGVFVRRFTSNGVPLRAETQVNVYATGAQDGVSLAVDATGDFVVVWRSVGQDGDQGGIFARHFRATGVPTTGDLPVNDTKIGSQFDAAVRSDADGDFAVVWTSFPQDGDGSGVFGQRFDVPPLLDIDGNGELTALTDGLLVLRFLFGFTGTTLTAGAVGPSCTRCDAAAILPYLQSLT